MSRRMFVIIATLLLACIAPALSRTSSATEPPSPREDGSLPGLTAIAGRGMMDSRVDEYLEELSDNIGGRVTGSPQSAQAIEWAVTKMKAIGLSNVHTEKWQMTHGWTRGHATAELVSPIHRRLSVDSMGWVGSTQPGGVETDLISVNSYRLEEETRENASKWAGKVLIIVQKGSPPKDGADAFAKFGEFLRAAYAAHAVAVIGGQGGGKASGMNLTHTGVLGFDTFYDIPVVSMTAEDQDQLERFIDHGKTVRIKIDVENQESSGSVESANVVGEIQGTEHPEQILVVGGHLDSWDLAEGATDNGVGAACTLGAAEAILSSGHKPRRTIRFVLFTGEEQGLLGSFAYVKAHQDEMANHLGDLIIDNGQGPVTVLNMGGREDLVPAVKKFAESVKSFADLKVDDGVMFGTDTGPFTLAGLPGINMGQDSPEYLYTHHSAADSFDKIKAEIIDQDATLMALTAYWIADRPERLASPWPPEKTAKMLVDKKEDKFLKEFGLWPFGDLGSTSEKEPTEKK